MIRTYYFGDARNAGSPWATAGHHLHVLSAGGELRRVYEESAQPWATDTLDQTLARALSSPEDSSAGDEQQQGVVRLHHREGWSAISFWDRSGDRRLGSCSAFLAKGIHDARAMTLLFEESFPGVWARVARAFTLTLPHERTPASIGLPRYDARPHDLMPLNVPASYALDHHLEVADEAITDEKTGGRS